MITELKIPAVGESITQVQVSEWLKREGDEVKEDETVAIIDSEKTTFELPAPQAGRLANILHKAGETVNVGEVIGRIESNGDAGNPTKKPVANGKKIVEAPREQKGPDKNKAETKTEEEIEEPVTVEDSNPAEETKPRQPENYGKTIKPPETQEPEKTERNEPSAPRPEGLKKVTKPAENRPKTVSSSNREEEVVAMSMLRRTVARRLVEAQQAMAMLTTFNEIDMSAVQTLRKEQQEAFEKRHGVKLGFMSFFVKAAIEALKQSPQLNAEIRDNNIVYRNYFDLGVAIASERGLVVPILRNAERSSFAELEKAIGDFARRAREGKLNPEELSGGTFTITNGGVFGSLLSTPIINPPQSGILGMHTIQERPMAVNGQVVIRPMMYVALTYDHRLVDGREAVLFLRRVKELIETPARILLEV